MIVKGGRGKGKGSGMESKKRLSFQPGNSAYVSMSTMLFFQPL